MRASFLAILLLASVCIASATSYLIELPQKLSYSCLIARVRVIKVTQPKNPSSPVGTALIQAEILELFKGPVCKEISFSSPAYAMLEPAKLPILMGKEFIIFLHDPSNDGKLWLFEGPEGMRPIARHYTEYRVSSDPDLELHTDTYSHEQYLDILRNWKSHVDATKPKP